MQTRLIMIWLCLFYVVCSTHAQNHVLSLDGDGDYVRIGKQLELVSDHFTIEAWFYPRNTIGWRHIISRWEWGEQSYEIFFSPQKQIYVGVRNSAGRSFSFYAASPALNQWRHVALTLDGKKLWAYLNGIRVGELSFDGIPNRPAIPLLIGASRNGTQMFFDGFIDDVRIWNVARSQEQIVEGMYPPFEIPAEGLVAYWSFEGDGESAVDVTGNGHNGSLIGDAQRIASKRSLRSALLTRDEIYQGYLKTLKLDLTVQRHKPTEFTDVLKITTRLSPESTVFTMSSVPVTIEVEDLAQRRWATMKKEAGDTLEWTVPPAVQGRLRITVIAAIAQGTYLW